MLFNGGRIQFPVCFQLRRVVLLFATIAEEKRITWNRHATNRSCWVRMGGCGTAVLELRHCNSQSLGWMGVLGSLVMKRTCNGTKNAVKFKSRWYKLQQPPCGECWLSSVRRPDPSVPCKDSLGLGSWYTTECHTPLRTTCKKQDTVEETAVLRLRTYYFSPLHRPHLLRKSHSGCALSLPSRRTWRSSWIL